MSESKIMNMEGNRKMKSHFIYIDCLTEGDYKYYVPGNCNCLVKQRIADNELEIIAYFSNMPVTQKCTYRKVIKWKEKIICIPWHSTDFIVVDEKTSNIKYIKIPQMNRAKIKHAFFFEAKLIGSQIYAFGYNYCGILKFDCDTLESKILDNWINAYRIKASYDAEVMFTPEMIFHNNRLYTICTAFPGIFEFDLENEKYHFFCIEKEGAKLSHINVDENLIYISTKNNEIIIFNKQKNEIEQIVDLNSWCEKEDSILYLVVNKESIDVFMGDRKNVLILSKKKPDKIVKINLPKAFVKNSSVIPYKSEIDSETVLFCDFPYSEMFVYTKSNRQITQLSINIPQNVLNMKQYLRMHAILDEDSSKGFSLDNYIKMVLEET
ncbi:MAG: hypothetical protein HDR24_07315 [Lachnospiraceae bacterium]|nr:hypothetical protein [Lachnospiraceae bacterium]